MSLGTGLMSAVPSVDVPSVGGQESTSSLVEMKTTLPRQSISFQIRDRIFRFRIMKRTDLDESSLADLPNASFRVAQVESPLRKVTPRLLPTRPQPDSTPLQPFQCPSCTRIFTNKRLFDAHTKTHEVVKSYYCRECTKTFTRLANYQAHLRLHTSGRRHFCSLCGKWFRNVGDLLEHQVSLPFNENLQQLCLARQQGEVIPTERPLRYECSFCEKMFHHRRDKNIHERTHTGIRPFSCGYCNKSFTQSQALTVHIRKHTGERPFVCHACGDQFTDSSALRKHEFSKHPNFSEPSVASETDISHGVVASNSSTFHFD